MDITLWINNKIIKVDIKPQETLLNVLRKNGYFGTKFGGCKKGECGACTVLIDSKPYNSCKFLAIRAVGQKIETIENEGENPQKGWVLTKGLSIIQQCFIDNGAIQCGYCTPAMILAAKALLLNNPDPSEKQVRQAISPILCRCTGYEKPVKAILRAASILRGEEDQADTFLDLQQNQLFNEITSENHVTEPIFDYETNTKLEIKKKLVNKYTSREFLNIGKPEPKVDSSKLVQGKPAFTDDIEMRGMLIAKVLRSPHAHARILSIDHTKAKQLKGVAAILTWNDVPRVVYSTAGQSDPIPGPLDTFSLDKKVRFVGDRVAIIAAETEAIAEKALSLINVKYEILSAIIDPLDAQSTDAPIIHDEIEYLGFDHSDPQKNLASQIKIDIGDVEKGFQEADHIFEEEYTVPKVQQAHIEPHVAITYWDEDDRLVIRTSTQVPFHVRRVLSPILGLPIKRIRVIKPRIGGGFGGKQEILMEDIPAHLTMVTGRPVRYEYTREEEFIASRSRHPMKIKMKTGVLNDGTITANEMNVVSDTGAYGCHALTVTGNTGHKSMALYVGDGKYRISPNIRFYADIVYTNTPPSGAYRGYGVPQGYWPIERHMETIARSLKIDPIDFRLKNSLRAGELHPFSTAWSEGREPTPEIIQTVGLEDCVKLGKQSIEWDNKFSNDQWHIVDGKPHLRRGIGIALVMQGTAIPFLDMGGASIKLNDDGSFNLMIGATDLGTGSDTVLAQMAGEILGVKPSEIIVYSSDTDFTPFDKGAYASSTTYISGAAVCKAAQIVADSLKQRAAKMIFGERYKEDDAKRIRLKNGSAITEEGNDVSIADIALNSLHHNNQEQIMGVASYVSPVSPPPFAAQFAEVTVDIETGQLVVNQLVMAVDSGVIINPATASGQIEGGMTQALGYAVCEEMKYDSLGRARETDLFDYHIFRADEMPDLTTIFVETYEPTHPFGVKAVAEIPMDGVAPAIGNAIFDACGAKTMEIPLTPERIWRAIRARG